MPISELPSSRVSLTSPQLEQGWDDAIGALYKAKRPHLANIDRAIAEMSGRLGIHTPRFYIAPRFGIAFGGVGPNMVAQMPTRPEYGGAIVATQSFLDLFRYSPHADVPKEIQAAFAHELGHMKQGWARIRFWTTTGAMGAGVATSLAAVYLMDRVLNERKDPHYAALPPEQQLQAAAQGMRDEMAAAQGTPVNALHSELSSLQLGIVGVAEAAVAGALGIAGRDLTVRHMMRHFEFDADRTAALLLGDHKPVVRMLTAVTHGLRDAVRKDPEALKTLTWRDVYDGLTRHAHPPLGERIAALELFGKTLSTRAAGIVR
jgi:Zn-dependent protease with chaperone function